MRKIIPRISKGESVNALSQFKMQSSAKAANNAAAMMEAW
jgi:hypothetical protein